MKQSIITGLLIVGEIVLGAILGQEYINSYSLWSSDQTLGQFFATVILIYSMPVFLLGTINLRVIKMLEKETVVRSMVTSMVFGTIFALPIFFLPYRIVDNLSIFNLSPFAIILVGLVVGFNFQLITKGKE